MSDSQSPEPHDAPRGKLPWKGRRPQAIRLEGHDVIPGEPGLTLAANTADLSESDPDIGGFRYSPNLALLDQCIERYEIGAELGRGGVGIVHKAWDRLLHRRVAIKVLRPENLRNRECVRRFLEEAHVTSRLQHPNIVSVHDIGVSPEHLPFFVMSMVEGRTLSHLLEERKESLADIPKLLGSFLRVSQAVAHAHNMGIIHRDLKPANVIVGDLGAVTVMDWGLAKVLNQADLETALTQVATKLGSLEDVEPTIVLSLSPHETPVGTIFGTPAYLSPEQALGETGLVDRRADVFGLGSILCEILTGFPPYLGTDGTEVFKRALVADMAECYERLDASPVAVDLISLAKWCLAPDPADRPRDASDVADVLLAYLQSDQRRAEQDLVRFFDLSLDLFCIASTKGYFTRVNDNFSRLLGYSNEELLSRPFLDFVHPEDRARTQREVVKLSEGELCIQFLNRYRHVEGRYLWFEWSAQAIPEERAIYAVARNVTDRVEHAQNIEMRAKRPQKAKTLKPRKPR